MSKGNCVPYSGNDMFSDRDANLIQTNGQEKRHLMLTYKNGAQCSAMPGRKYNFRIEVLCDESKTNDDYDFDLNYEGDPCSPIVTFSSKHGCEVMSINAIWTFLNKYKYVWGAFFIVLGLALNFFGRKLFKPTLCIAGTITVAFALMLFFYSVVLNDETKSWVGWLVLVCCVLVGALVGFLLAKVARLGVAILAAWGGVSVGLICYTAFLYHLHSQVAFWIILVVFALVFASLTCCVYDHVLILATAFAGSYSFVRGISMYAGGYPNEFTLYSYISKGLMKNVPGTFYAYMAGFIVLAILGSVVQYKMRSRDVDRKRHPYHRHI